VGGIVLALSKMDRIKAIDTVEMSATVQPGVVTKKLQRAVEAEGLFYPPDPASAAFCTIGGNVNTGAGGARAVKYGVTRDYVKSLEVVLADGSIIRTGATTSKGVVGYDLTHLFVGAEGTLGIVTEVVLRLTPMPEAAGMLAAVFTDFHHAVDSVTCLFQSGLLPRCAEFMDEGCLNVVRDVLPFETGKDSKALLIIEVDGPSASIHGQGCPVVSPDI
jgi:glycolate oxidase